MLMLGVASVEADAERSTLAAVQQGDRAAFADFLRRQETWIRGVIFAVLGDLEAVDDVAQQVYTILWSRIGELRDLDAWRAWVYRLTRNMAIDAGRDLTRRRRFQKKLTGWARRAFAESPAKKLMDEETHGAVLAAIKDLPEHYREPFVLRHLEGWSYEQIGRTMNLPIDTVETRLVRARRMLRTALNGRV